jgi:hypothetical protein
LVRPQAALAGYEIEKHFQELRSSQSFGAASFSLMPGEGVIECSRRLSKQYLAALEEKP